MLFNNESMTPLLNLTSIQGKDLEIYNLLKYRMICAILDYLALCKNMDCYPAKNNVREMLINNKIISDSRIGRAMANAAFAEMCMMGIILEDGDYIILTESAVKAYKTNTFHQICASLTAAHESHKVGVRTLWVSILALIVALSSLIVTFCK
ncbi:MAG: hypothetical protein HDS18_02725 [Bacteroides sp.]|nr:hypothetical protein [Bacteroides sp.]